jgi:hypothetical protein
MYTDSVQVVITGDNFITVPTFPRAWLGTNEITITDATSRTLTGTIPAFSTPGVYALTVRNPPPDECPDTLSPAYTALPGLVTTLETGLVSTFGPAAPTNEGDDDHVQEIFFDVPASYTGDIAIWIFDADTGGTLDELPSNNTTMQYTLYGSGPLTQTVIGADPGGYDGEWVPVFGPYPADAGAPVGSSQVFRLTVTGVSGDDGNVYNVALSTNSATNTAPPDSRIFAYAWTFPVYANSPRWLYPYVPQDTLFFEQHNWDMDDLGTIRLYTPIRDFPVPVSAISGNGAEAWSSHGVDPAEDGATWSVRMEFASPPPDDHRTFWAIGEDLGGRLTSLAIFTLPTTSPPP